MNISQFVELFENLPEKERIEALIIAAEFALENNNTETTKKSA